MLLCGLVSQAAILTNHSWFLLELYKARAIETLQEEPLGELKVSWTGIDVDPAVVAASDWE